jgi:vitamin K-dependent gamma-carboxylase
MTARWMRLVAWLGRPTDPASLAAFRFLYGTLVALGSARFIDAGWPEKLYGTSSFFFRFAGLSWVPAVDGDSAHTCYVAFIILGIGIATGTLYRLCIGTFVLLFTFIQLGDVTNYLNHYWLVILLGVLLTVVPAHAVWSIDAWLLGARRSSVPFAVVAVLRCQVAVVYVFAAVAKIGSDWLVYGQPLGVWLPPRSSLPFIGPLLTMPVVPLLLSWGGFVYDASIVPLLLWRRSRPFAYALVVVFHGMTRAFFDIGMFPFIMVTATTLYFDPSWPRRLLARITRRPFDDRSQPMGSSSLPSRGGQLMSAAVVLWCAVQIALPMRTFVMGIGSTGSTGSTGNTGNTDVLWDEAGMRFSWRVMVREKSGSLDYRVTFTDDVVGRRTVRVSPHDWLSWRQVNEMIGQPDLILQLAHAIRDDFHRRGFHDVEVRADCRITLNGRAASVFINPDTDLAREADCLFCRHAWVMPRPTSSPPSPWRSTPAVTAPRLEHP